MQVDDLEDLKTNLKPLPALEPKKQTDLFYFLEMKGDSCPSHYLNMEGWSSS